MSEFEKVFYLCFCSLSNHSFLSWLQFNRYIFLNGRKTHAEDKEGSMGRTSREKSLRTSVSILQASLLNHSFSCFAHYPTDQLLIYTFILEFIFRTSGSRIWPSPTQIYEKALKELRKKRAVLSVQYRQGSLITLGLKEKRRRDPWNQHIILWWGLPSRGIRRSVVTLTWQERWGK